MSTEVHQTCCSSDLVRWAQQLLRQVSGPDAAWSHPVCSQLLQQRGTLTHKIPGPWNVLEEFSVTTIKRRLFGWIGRFSPD